MSGEWIGWVATVLVVISFLVRSSVTLRRIQAVSACLWLAYGVVIHSMPVIVANIIVAGTALLSSFRKPVSAATVLAVLSGLSYYR